MELTWLGHGCFRLRAKEATVVTDPVDKTGGYSLGRPTADLVTVSCDEPTHSAVGAIANEPRVIDGPGEFEIRGVSLTGIATPRGHDNGRGRNVAFVIELEDMRIGHLGAIGRVPTSDQVEEMGAIDILLVPVGGACAIDAPPAAETVALLEPKLVIPMHFRTDVDKAKLDPVDRFLKEMGAKAEEHHTKLAVTRSSLPDTTQVLVLDYKK
jgi:L-ascorbate metabolism protein UlaG (beta-lactamase superfamily)